jgi:hypothetical protein
MISTGFALTVIHVMLTKYEQSPIRKGRTRKKSSNHNFFFLFISLFNEVLKFKKKNKNVLHKEH